MLKRNKATIIILLSLLIILLMGVPNNQTARAESDTQNRVPISVGLILDERGIDDQGYNEMANEGLGLAVNDFSVTGIVYSSTSPDDYATKISDCVVAEHNLCITVGFMMADATMSAALANSGVEFAIVDMTYDTYPDNLRGVTFAVEEAAYLAGSLASLMTASNVIGAIGGMAIQPVDAFVLPYQYGAQWTKPETTVLLDYADTFTEPEIGAQLAQNQMAQGADVIFGVGGPMGNGAIVDAAQAGAWVIGVDVDVWVSVFGEGTVDGSEKVLTSVIKQIDNAVYNTIGDLVNSLTPTNRSFTGGTVVYGIADEGVGFAPYNEAENFIPSEVKDILEDISQRIIAGEIDVWAPFYSHLIYLPLTMH